MFKKHFKIITLTLILSVGLNACASKGINLTKTGAVKVQIINSDQVLIANVYVKQLENEVLIHAVAKPTNPVRFFTPVT